MSRLTICVRSTGEWEFIYIQLGFHGVDRIFHSVKRTDWRQKDFCRQPKGSNMVYIV